MTRSIEFNLFAPNNQAASLIGSFSDWQKILLQKDERGYFRTAIDLADGVYHYKFVIQSKSSVHEPDEWIEINDPYATEIDGSTGNSVVRIKDGKKIIDTYVWQHDDKPLPANETLVIYEILIADFAESGKYQNLIDKLDYLCELGINAIELMPVNECPGSYTWGYTPSYFFAPQPNYGSTADFKRLIDECHARGIRVILDQLVNHSSEECPLFHIDREYWYYRDRHHPEESYYWGPEFNYEYYDRKLNIRPAWKFMAEVVRFWISEYHIDGIRYDALKQLDNREFLSWIIQQAKKAAGAKPFYNIGECVPEKVDIVTPKGPLDGCWHDSFYHFVQPQICGDRFDLNQLKAVLNPQDQEYPEGVTQLINYINNHDQERIFANLGDRGIFDVAASKRVKLGVTILMTTVGVPLLWMGEEFGEYARREPNKSKKLNWSLLNHNFNRNLFEYYKSLISLRKQNKALLTPHIEFFHENPHDRVFAYVRWNDEGSRVVVVANFSDRYFHNYQIPNFPSNGSWHEWVGNYDVNVENNQLAIDLPQLEAKVFVV